MEIKILTVEEIQQSKTTFGMEYAQVLSGVKIYGGNTIYLKGNKRVLTPAQITEIENVKIIVIASMAKRKTVYYSEIMDCFGTTENTGTTITNPKAKEIFGAIGLTVQNI